MSCKSLYVLIAVPITNPFVQMLVELLLEKEDKEAHLGIQHITKCLEAKVDLLTGPAANLFVHFGLIERYALLLSVLNRSIQPFPSHGILRRC